MDRSNEYSEDLYTESMVYEDHGLSLRELAKALFDTASILEYAAYDLQDNACLARKASHESQSFSFDPQPPPTDQNIVLARLRIQSAQAAAAISNHCSKVIKANLNELVTRVKGEEKRKIGATRIQVYDAKSADSDSGTDSSEACFPFPCHGNDHVPTCSKNLFTASQATSNPAHGGRSQKRPAHIAFLDEDSTLVETPLSRDSDDEDRRSNISRSRRLGVPRNAVSRAAHRLEAPKITRARGVSRRQKRVPNRKAKGPRNAKSPLFWIPESVSVSPAAVLGHANNPEAHPYGL